jgi:kinesin family protein 4/21/27
VFASDAEQRELFDVCARNLVLGCFVGYNATILAYGQTGSGKTHTMGTGSTSGVNEEAIGIVPRVFQFIFEELERKKKESSFSEFCIKISFLELYNEELHDLLDMGALDRATGKPLKELVIKEKNGSIFVHNLKEEVVSCKEECLNFLNKGILQRTTSATLMNEGSSRSHAILTITIEQRIVKEIDVPEGAGDKPGSGPAQSEE